MKVRPRVQAPIIVRRITGTSMSPTFRPGQLVIGLRWWRRLRVGDVIVVHHELMEKIKRVERLEGNSVWLLGDNRAASTDSRHFGPVRVDMVVARVLHRSRD